MNARSNSSPIGSERSVSSAGAIRSSILLSTPASFQYRRAIAVHSSLTSQQSRRPSSGRPRARASAEYPVNVPISMTFRAADTRHSMVMNAPCSGAICILLTPPSAAVSSISRCWMSSGGVPWPTMYAWSSSLNQGDFDATSAGYLESGSSPDGEPATDIGLDRQVTGDQRPDLQFERRVAPLGDSVDRRERVERPALVEIHQHDRLPGTASQTHRRAQQRGAETGGLQRAVHRVQIGDKRGHVVGRASQHKPGVAVVVSQFLRLRAAQERGDLSLETRERATLGLTEAHGADTGGADLGRRLEGERGSGQREQGVEVGLRLPRPAEQGVEQAHAHSCPSSTEILASWSRRFSSGGCDAKRAARSILPVTAGTKKNALYGSAARRSLAGILAISPEILVSALARTEGWPVSMAPARSAASSRERESRRG